MLAFGLDRFIAEPLKIEDDFAIAPDRPGHGIEFGWKGLEMVRACPSRRPTNNARAKCMSGRLY